MSPRSSNKDAASSKQNDRNGSPATAPVASPSDPAASLPATVPAPIPAEPAPLAPSSDPQPRHVDCASHPRVFVASALKPVSAIDTVASTISALSHHANRGITSLIASHSTANSSTSPLVSASVNNQSTPLRSDGSVSPIYHAFHNAGSTPDPARIQAALTQAALEHQPRILWSRWDRLALKSTSSRSAPLLVSYFEDGTLQLLLVRHRQITELLCLPHAAHQLLPSSAGAVSTAPHVLTAFVRHPTSHATDAQLLLVVQDQDGASRLLAYSLSAHHVQASVELRHPPLPPPSTSQHNPDAGQDLWPQVEVVCNDRFIVLSFAHPASVHVLSASTLEYLYAPIRNASSSSALRPPSISLSHRLLAFTCTASAHPSSARSDAARHGSNPAYHDPSRPLSAAQADASGRVGEMRDNLFETSAHVGDAARRIRGGVLSGVRTLGEWRTSYWQNPAATASPQAESALSPPKPSLLSQSAPHTARPLPPASSTSSSPMLHAADATPVSDANRMSIGSPSSLSVQPDEADAAANAVSAGCVRVVDLGSDARTLCTFAPTGVPTTRVVFSPCGRMILTADTLGHAFHVFELPLSGSFGNAATSAPSSVLHRYKLMRGITTADVVRAEWTHDSQWITVGTRSGTVHVYAVNPFGGVPIIDNHVQGKVMNPQVLQPVGISLASLARSSRPSPPAQQEALAKPGGVAGGETVSAAALSPRSRTSPPTFILVAGTDQSGVDPDGEASVPFELLTIDPRTGSVTLHSVRCWSSQDRAYSAGSSNQPSHSTSPESKQRFAPASSPRDSGLSQMMRKAGEGLLLHGHNAPRLQAECVRVAVWEQLAPQPGALSKHTVLALADQGLAARPADRAHHSSIANAEIETYSQSPAMLPSSIFLSRQTFFHARLRNGKLGTSSEAMRCVQRRGSRPVQVRRTARVVSREPPSEHSSSFDDTMAGAFDRMSFDPDHLPARGASAHIPSFPQGQRGRSSGWTSGSSIPIRIVAGGLGGIYRAGKEIGRGVDMARRRASGASATTAPDVNGAFRTTSDASISFDGVDDVDLLGDDEPNDRSSRRLYKRNSGVDLGSARSDASLLSALRNDRANGGSQPSSAETPSTRFSEPEDPPADAAEADADECDWDAVQASRSPAAPEALLFDAADRQRALGTLGGDSLDDDFTVGILEVDEELDSGEATMSHSRASLSLSPGIKGKAAPAKELVYALPAGGSTRSSLISHSSALTPTADGRAESKSIGASIQESRPASRPGGEGESQTSASSGLLCEGGKETRTIDSSPVPATTELDASLQVGEGQTLDIETGSYAAAEPKISTSGGGKKKKRKNGGR